MISKTKRPRLYDWFDVLPEVTLVRLFRVCNRFIHQKYWKRFYLQRLVRSPNLRSIVASALSKTLPKTSVDFDTDEDSIELAEKGVVVKNSYFSKSLIDQIVSHLKNKALEGDSIQSYYTDLDVLEAPGIFNILNDEKLLNIASVHLGCMPTLTAVGVWWLHAEFDNEEASEKHSFYAIRENEFHRDIDDWKFVRVLIYLDDVDTDTGPHLYIPQTQKLSLPGFRALDFDEHTEYKDLLYKKIEIVGKKGTVVIIDPMGLHRAKVPKSRDRLMMQCTFGMYPHPFTPNSPLVTGTEVGANTNYTNRFFVR